MADRPIAAHHPPGSPAPVAPRPVSPPPHPAGGYDSDLVAKSATWLVGASAAVAAAAIAGLQLTQVPSRLVPAALALLGFGNVLLAAGYTLITAVRVQAERFHGLNDLTDAHATGARRGGGRRAATLPWIEPRILALTDQEAETIPDLVERIHELDGRLRAWRTGDAIPGDIANHYEGLDGEALQGARRRLAEGARRIVDAASYRLTQLNFERLRGSLPWVGLALAVGVGLFAGAVAYDKGLPPASPFANPVAVLVFPADGEAGACQGWAVDGTWELPTVLVPHGQQCGAAGEVVARRTQWLVVPAAPLPPQP